MKGALSNIIRYQKIILDFNNIKFYPDTANNRYVADIYINSSINIDKARLICEPYFNAINYSNRTTCSTYNISDNSSYTGSYGVPSIVKYELINGAIRFYISATMNSSIYYIVKPYGLSDFIFHIIEY